MEKTSRNGKGEKVDKSIYVKYSLVDKFSEYPNFIDVLSLYVFYHKMGIQQRTNQPYATDTYCMKGLRIGSVRFYEAKKILKKLKLIEQVEVGRTKRRFGKSYIRLKDKQKEIKERKEREELEERQARKERERTEESLRNWNAMTGGMKRTKPSRKEKDLKCPHGHRFGIDLEDFDDCDECKFWHECNEW